jgi:hypothetical protein
MATLSIASKANQATTIPPLLVAGYAKESDPNASININFEDVEALRSGGRTAVELILGNGTLHQGSENAISGILEAYPSLQSKQEGQVRIFSVPKRIK